MTAIAAHRLREAIVNGDLGLGEPLSESALAERFGMSKTPVREALARLRLEGLVTIAPQKGSFVFTLGAREVTELAELRLVLETAALRFAYERRRRELLAGLRNVLDHMESTFLVRDIRGYLHLDTDFHHQFFRHCANAYLAEAYRLLEGKAAAVRTHLSARPKYTLRSFAEHRRIVQCLERDDLATALAVLTKHIGRAGHTYHEAVEDIAAADRQARTAAGSRRGQPPPL